MKKSAAIASLTLLTLFIHATPAPTFAHKPTVTRIPAAPQSPLAAAVEADLNASPDQIFTIAERLLKTAPLSPDIGAIQVLMRRYFRGVQNGRARFITWLTAVLANPLVSDEVRAISAFNLSELWPQGERWRRAPALLHGPSEWAVAPVTGDFSIDAFVRAEPPACSGPEAGESLARCAKEKGWRRLRFDSSAVGVYQPEYKHSGVAWAVSDIAADAPRLLVYQGGTATVYVDGQPFFGDPDLSRYPADFRLGRLSPGAHRLAVKVLMQEASTQFELALLPATGRPAPAIAPLTRALLAEALGDEDSARELLLPHASDKPGQPDSRALRWRLAQSYRINRLQILPGKLAEEKERALIETLLKEKPVARLHMRLAEFAEHNEDHAHAAEHYTAALALAPGNADFQLLYAEYLERRGFKSEAWARRRQAEPLATGRESPLSRLLEHAIENREVAREERLAAALQPLDPGDDSLEHRSRQRDLPGYLTAQKKRYEGYPDPNHLIAAFLAGLEAAAGTPQDGLARLRAAYGGRVAGGARQLEADLLSQTGKTDEALALLRTLAAESSGAEEARDTLALHGETEPVMAWRQTDEQRRLAMARPAGPAELPTEFLLDWSADYYYPDHSRRSIYHSLTRVLTAQGVEQEAQLTIPEGARLLRLGVIKPDGRVLEPGEPESGKYLLPDLEPGDIIEQEYLETGATGEGSGSLKAGAADNRRIFLFNSNRTRTRRSEQYIVGPGIAACEVVTANGLTDQGDAKPGKHFRVDEPVRYAPEPLRPPERAYIPWAGVNCGSQPEDALHFWEGTMRWRTRSTAELRVLAAQLAKGALSDDERLDRLFAYLQSEIKGEWKLAMEDPSFVLFNRDGNRLMVARSILQIWKFPHEFWLASDPGEYEATQTLPSTTIFGQPQLIRLKYRGAERFIALGSEYGPADLIPPALGGTHCVVINAAGAARFDSFPETPADASLIDETRQVADDGSAAVTGKLVFSSFLSAKLRSQLTRLPADKREPVYESVVQKIVPGIKLTTAAMSGFNGYAEPLTLHYEGDIGGATRVSRGLQLPQTAADSGLSAIADPQSRSLPLWMNPSEEVEKIRVTLLPPAGMALEAPAPLTLDVPGVKYRLEYIALPGGGLRYERDYERLRLRLPVDQYPKWAADIRKSRAAEQLRPVLVTHEKEVLTSEK
jgi:hypothetical protein